MARLNAKVRSHTIKEHNQGDTMLVEFTVHPDDESAHAPTGMLRVQMPIAKAKKEYALGSCHYIQLRESQTKFGFEPEVEAPKDPRQGKLSVAGKPAEAAAN